MIYWMRFGTYEETDPQERNVVASISQISKASQLTTEQVKYRLENRVRSRSSVEPPTGRSN